MIVVCNDHMKYVFIPSWVSFSDKFIYIWNNKFICPGWMFVNRKAYLKVNEYHTICCGDIRILYRWKLVDRKYSQKGLGSPQFETVLGTYTMALMCMMNKSLWVTGKKVIMYSCFYVLKGFIGVYYIGFYGSRAVKKCNYWPSGIYGDQINAH